MVFSSAGIRAGESPGGRKTIARRSLIDNDLDQMAPRETFCTNMGARRPGGYSRVFEGEYSPARRAGSEKAEHKIGKRRRQQGAVDDIQHAAKTRGRPAPLSLTSASRFISDSSRSPSLPDPADHHARRRTPSTTAAGTSAG